jgi:hypothetical protein
MVELSSQLNLSLKEKAIKDVLQHIPKAVDLFTPEYIAESGDLVSDDVVVLDKAFIDIEHRQNGASFLVQVTQTRHDKVTKAKLPHPLTEQYYFYPGYAEIEASRSIDSEHKVKSAEEKDLNELLTSLGKAKRKDANKHS